MIDLRNVTIAAGFAVALASATSAHGMPIAPTLDAPSMTVQVSGGCGPHAWRGPWGHCRDTPYYGRLPNGRWKAKPVNGNGCPPGYWRGPWGHCRDTPFHGRLPGGGWR